MTQANRNTIKLRIKELVQDGYLTPHGQGKGTWYTLVPGIGNKVQESRAAFRRNQAIVGGCNSLGGTKKLLAFC